MPQIRKDLSLVPKAAHSEIGVAAAAQQLDGDAHGELLIDSTALVHGAHAAKPDQPRDRIRTNRATDDG